MEISALQETEQWTIFTHYYIQTLMGGFGKTFFLLFTAMAPQTWTLWKTEQKYLYSFEMWCWRRMEELSWTNFVKNEEVWHSAVGGMEHSAYITMKEG
jgi:hypothetical protein